MRRRGFTLIEVLITLALTALLLGLFAQVFRSATFARDRVQERGGVSGALRRCFETMSRDIHSATVPPDDSGVQFGLTSAGTASSGSGADVLQFASVVGEPLLVGRTANETVLIQYAVGEDPRTGAPTLWRYETAYPVPETTGSSAGQSEDTRTMPLLSGVGGITYLFYSPTQQTWVETWENETGLPAAIRVDLSLLADATEEEPRIQSWVFSVPAAGGTPTAEETEDGSETAP